MYLGLREVEAGPIMPLKLVRSICETPENVNRNIERTVSNTYVRFNEFLDSQDGPISICGSGPSFARTYKHIVGDVIACNGAHDFLIENGIIPRFGMLFDASPLMGKFITPRQDIIYFIASRCHESVFKKLEGFKVVVWHCKGDEGLDEILEQRRIMEPMVHGGSAAVGRAIFLSIAMGYRDIHIFGADSSLEGETIHTGPSLVPENVIDIWCGKWFKSTAWMAGQVEDFKEMIPKLIENGSKFVVHGNGLLPQVAKAMGLDVRDYSTT